MTDPSEKDAHAHVDEEDPYTDKRSSNWQAFTPIPTVAQAQEFVSAITTTEALQHLYAYKRTLDVLKSTIDNLQAAFLESSKGHETWWMNGERVRVRVVTPTKRTFKVNLMRSLLSDRLFDMVTKPVVRLEEWHAAVERGDVPLDVVLQVMTETKNRPYLRFDETEQD